MAAARSIFWIDGWRRLNDLCDEERDSIASARRESISACSVCWEAEIAEERFCGGGVGCVGCGVDWGLWVVVGMVGGVVCRSVSCRSLLRFCSCGFTTGAEVIGWMFLLCAAKSHWSKGRHWDLMEGVVVGFAVLGLGAGKVRSISSMTVRRSCSGLGEGAEMMVSMRKGGIGQQRLSWMLMGVWTVLGFGVWVWVWVWVWVMVRVWGWVWVWFWVSVWVWVWVWFGDDVVVVWVWVCVGEDGFCLVPILRMLVDVDGVEVPVVVVSVVLVGGVVLVVSNVMLAISVGDVAVRRA